jgi:hypothetical protein
MVKPTRALFFDKLRAAFDDKDRKNLMRLWNSAEHYC